MIDVKTLKELRDRSGAGLQDCRNALEKFSGNADKAFEHLRNAGMVNIASRDERENNEGIVFQASSEDKAVMIHLACETDFAANSRQFRETGDQMLRICLDSDSPRDAEIRCSESVTELKLLLHENLELKGLVIFNTSVDEKLFMYRHHTGKAGSMIKFSCSGTEKKAVQDFILDLALHAAAEKPLYFSEDTMSSKDYAEIREDCTREFEKLDKSEVMRDKIIDGMIRKRLRRKVFLNQAFIKDETISIAEYIDSFRQKTGADIRILETAWLSVT